MNNWFAIRLKPMAARPSKHDPRYTNIEFALGSAGIEHYMPFERKEIIHHRTKQRIDKKFPLVQGYCFVMGVTDWFELHRVDYVASVVGVKGSPLPIREGDIEQIRMAEAAISLDYQAQKARRDAAEYAKAHRMTKRSASMVYPSGSLIRINQGHMLLGGQEGIVKEATGRNTIRAMILTLNGMVNAEIPFDLVEKVA